LRSVVQIAQSRSLYTVVETQDEKTTNHTIYYDRFGWYCIHGKECPAVAEVVKQATPTTRNRRA
jgi:hypothetical protein